MTWESDMRLAGLIVLVAVSGAASAQSMPLEKAIADCAAVSGASERLECFDALAGRLQAAPRQTTSAAPPPNAIVQAPSASAPATVAASAAVTSPAPSASPVAKFGAEGLTAAPATASNDTPAELEEIQAKVVAVQYSSLGRFTISLDNGQVWRQQDGDSKRAQFRSKGGETVSISRGFLGSYNLVIETRTGLYKVKRVR